MKYSAKIGDRTFLLEVGDGKLILDGEEIEASFLATAPAAWSMIVDGRSVRVLVEPSDNGRYRITIDGVAHEVLLQDEHDLLLAQYGNEAAGGQHVRNVLAPMPGLVRALHVSEGDNVQVGNRLLVLEAMKMENELKSESIGVVRAIHVKPGDRVEKNQMLLEIGPESS